MITCDEGTELADFDHVVEFDLEVVSSVSFEYWVFAGGPPAARISIARRQGKVGIDGFLPIEATLWRFPAIDPIHALLAYVDFVADIARATEPRVLVVANEYSENVVPATNVVFPDLLVMFDEECVSDWLPILTKAGLQAEFLGGMVRVWLRSPAELMAGKKPDHHTVAALEEVIRGVVRSDE